MKNLIIIRGIPGAGKSTLAELISDNKHPICCADDFFFFFRQRRKLQLVS